MKAFFILDALLLDSPSSTAPVTIQGDSSSKISQLRRPSASCEFQLAMSVFCHGKLSVHVWCMGVVVKQLDSAFFLQQMSTITPQTSLVLLGSSTCHMAHVQGTLLHI